MPAPKRRILAIVFGLVVFLALLLPYLRPHSVPRYTVTDLGVLPGDTISWATGINNRGDVVGYVSTGASSGNVKAVEFQNGKIIALGSSIVGVDSIARGINTQGEVTGWVEAPIGNQAFVYAAGKKHILGKPPGFISSQGTAINDTGEVTGQGLCRTTHGLPSAEHAFIFSHGKMTDIGTLRGSLSSAAQSINATGQIVGECSQFSAGGITAYIPFLYDNRRKTMTALSLPAANLGGRATHINDAGQVAGFVAFSTGGHAALWNGGHFTDLGALPGDEGSGAEGLNNHGEIVGQSLRDNSGSISRFIERHTGYNNFWQRYWYRTTVTERAFVSQNGRMQDLNTLIPKDADWVLEDAKSVNDRGQIVGHGLHHGQERAFLLTPVRWYAGS